MTVVSRHHKPTPIINKLDLVAKDQTMIYCSLQINKSIASQPLWIPVLICVGKSWCFRLAVPHIWSQFCSLKAECSSRPCRSQPKPLQGYVGTITPQMASQGSGWVPRSSHFTVEKNQGHKVNCPSVQRKWPHWEQSQVPQSIRDRRSEAFLAQTGFSSFV